MSSEPAPPASPDADLIVDIRAGHLDAFAELYQRHVEAARRLARGLARNPADVDDLIAEAFARVFGTLRAGGGPSHAFRAYLFTTVRNAFHDRVRRDRRINLTDDLSPYDEGEPFVDPALLALERSYIARAFAKLPARWQSVLWYTEVEGRSPAALAHRLGLTPNGVAALAYRARERLRQMYLQEHVDCGAEPACRWTADRLGGYVRGALGPRTRGKVEGHLAGCLACRTLGGEVGEVNAALAVLSVAPTPRPRRAVARPAPPLGAAPAEDHGRPAGTLGGCPR